MPSSDTKRSWISPDGSDGRADRRDGLLDGGMTLGSVGRDARPELGLGCRKSSDNLDAEAGGRRLRLAESNGEAWAVDRGPSEVR